MNERELTVEGAIAELMALNKVEWIEDILKQDHAVKRVPEPGEFDRAVEMLPPDIVGDKIVDMDTVNVIYSAVLNGLILDQKTRVYSEGAAIAKQLFKEGSDTFKSMTAGQIQGAARAFFADLKNESEHMYELYTAGFVKQMLADCDIGID